MSNDLDVFMPIDRRYAWARAEELPARAHGAVLFADVAGWTPLAEALALHFGERRGADELTELLNRVYEGLTASVQTFGGSIVGFSGDAMTCWFDDTAPHIEPTFDASQCDASDGARRALACALAMQRTMAAFDHVAVAANVHAALAVKIAVAAGPVRRLLVGDPAIQVHDVLAGATLQRLAASAPAARRGEVIVDVDTAAMLAPHIAVAEWRATSNNQRGVAVVTGLTSAVAPRPWPALPSAARIAAAWVLPSVREQVQVAAGRFLAELRPATALMCSLSGFDYEASAAQAQFDALIRAVQHVLARYDAMLIDITTADKGSYLYAVFGAPNAHEDDPRRAIRAAAELLRVLPHELQPQIGISSGTMRVGAYGSSVRSTYGVLGEPANLACRLMEAAAPGDVWCDESVFSATSRFTSFAPLAPLQVKGKAELLHVYQLRGEHPQPTAAAPAGALVGRAAELAQLHAMLGAAARGERSILLLEGEAGIGKSRLVAELLRLSATRSMRSMRGGGQAIEQQTPFFAWRAVLSTYFGIDGVDDPAARQLRVLTQLRATLPTQLERAPLLNDLLGIDLPENTLTCSLDSAQRAENRTTLITALLAARATTQPLVLVLEDAQWLDSCSWELANQLARAAHLPLVLVITTRALEPNSASQAAMQTLLRVRGTIRRVLAPLGAAAIGDLVAQRLGDAPAALPDVTHVIHARSGGNPFFAEELLAALLDADTDTPTLPANWRERTALLPDTLQGVLLARLDRLMPEQQFVLKIAAVVGTTFAYPPLRYAYHQHADDADLKQHLRACAARHFTELEQPAPELVYRFTHVLTQEAVYQKLLHGQRRDLHHTVATWYEQLVAESSEPNVTERSPYVPLLAHHYHQAENNERERHYAYLAGVQAADQYANVEALDLFSRALELTPEHDADARWRILLAREHVYDLVANRSAQAADLTQLAAIGETLGDDHKRAQIALRRANYADVSADYTGMVAAAQQAVMLGQRLDAPDIEATGLMRWGWACMWLSDYPQARALLERAHAAAQQLDLPDVVAECVNTLGVVAERTGDFARATAHFENVLAMHQARGNRRGEALAYMNIGAAYGGRGDMSKAQDEVERALACYQAIGDRRGAVRALGNLGVITAVAGQLAASNTYLHEALRENRVMGDQRGEGLALLNLAENFKDAGDYAAAQQHLADSLRISADINDRYLHCSILCAQGLVALHRHDARLAEQCCRAAQTIASEIANPSNELAATTRLGHALLALERFDEAAAIYAAALARVDAPSESELWFELHAGLAALALHQHDHAVARAHADALRAGFRSHPLSGLGESGGVYLQWYTVLQALGDARAAKLLAHAYAWVQHAATTLGSAALTQSFLTQVAAHREIVRMFERASEV